MFMTSRQRVLTVLNGEIPDRVPRVLYGAALGFYNQSTIELFKKKADTDKPEDVFDMDILGVFPNPVKEKILPHNLKEFRYEGLTEKIETLHERGFAVAAWGYCHGIFEHIWGVYGFDNILADFMLNPHKIHAILDEITENFAQVASKLASFDIDILILGDDVGAQKSMIMSPQIWRTFLKPRLAKIINAAKKVKSGRFVFYHSDGYIEPIIPELIEIGVDILNPIQPECMNPAKFKREYGKYLIFFGTVGIQSTLPRGSPEDVKNEVKERIKTVGKDGGLILSPAHLINPDVPWENIVAFFEAADEYGWY